MLQSFFYEPNNYFFYRNPLYKSTIKNKLRTINMITMEIETIECDYEYMSDDPKITTLPFGYIDKQICGCGATSVVLENDEDVIVLVPLYNLTNNKSLQYPNDRYHGEVCAVNGNISDDNIRKYIAKSAKLKFICTWDSIHRIQHLINNPCRLIIDESQELIGNAHLKNKVINNVYKITKSNKDTITFISATPIPLEYLPKWISEIPQISYRFKNVVKAVPLLMERTYPNKALKEEIIMKLKDNGSVTMEGYTFRKVIVFVNSVTIIDDVIRYCNLSKKECGVICGDNQKNATTLHGIRIYTVGELPKYLFINKAGFIGMDLYDKEAMTVVVSSLNKDWHMIDMRTNLKQAICRQRIKSNPNYGKYIYIYNQFEDGITKEVLNKRVDDMKNIELPKLTKGYEILKEHGYQSKWPIPVNDLPYLIYDEVNDSYSIDENTLQSDRFFINETREGYKKGFDIQGYTNGEPIIVDRELPSTYTDVVKYFKQNHKSGVINDWGIFKNRIEWIELINQQYRILGKVNTNYYYATQLLESNENIPETLDLKIKQEFVTGKRYSKKEVKHIIQRIYDALDIKRTAKSTDLKEFMEIKLDTNGYVQIVSKRF